MGVRPNPYHVWLSEIMLQQTTVQAVKPHFEKFISIWPDVKALADAEREDVLKEWAGLGYYSRARNLHKCANEIVNEYDGAFPQDIQELKKLPGIGDYTSAAIASIAFDVPATVIDGNVERVVTRLYRIQTPMPTAKPEIKTKAKLLFQGENTNRPSCFAQSLMDLGATICTPKNPACVLCPIHDYCEGYKHGDASLYPIKLPKKKLPEKHALAYIYFKDNKIGIETRGETGMLAGMKGFPTSEWVDVKEALPEVGYDASRKIRHVFTHFALTLYPVIMFENHENMIDFNDVDDIGLPSLFQKLWNMIKSEL